jgi:hypothetical protein
MHLRTLPADSANCWDVWDSVKSFLLPTKHPPVVGPLTQMVAATKKLAWRIKGSAWRPYTFNLVNSEILSKSK